MRSAALLALGAYAQPTHSCAEQTKRPGCVDRHGSRRWRGLAGTLNGDLSPGTQRAAATTAQRSVHAFVVGYVQKEMLAVKWLCREAGGQGHACGGRSTGGAAVGGRAGLGDMNRGAVSVANADSLEKVVSPDAQGADGESGGIDIGCRPECRRTEVIGLIDGSGCFMRWRNPIATQRSGIKPAGIVVAVIVRNTRFNQRIGPDSAAHAGEILPISRRAGVKPLGDYRADRRANGARKGKVGGVSVKGSGRQKKCRQYRRNYGLRFADYNSLFISLK